MTQFQKDILNLIYCSLNNEKPTIKDIDYSAIFKFSIKQQIIGLLYPSLSKIEGFSNNKLYDDITNYNVINLMLSNNQEIETKKLFNEFDKENIDYVPLKGIILKKLYPKSDMRTMGDIDILIKIEQIEKINKIMSNLGFVFQYESDHELGFSKDNGVHIELHKRLIPSYNKDYYKYYGDGWNLVKNNKMSNEDTFIYIFTHFAKHYRDKGVGIKYIVDFYIYKNTYKELDYNYIEEELKKLQLFEFYKNIIDVIDVWFNDKKETDKTNFITNYLFNSYVYGNSQNGSLSEGLKISKTTKNIKLKRLFNSLFPSYETMCHIYQFLRKWWILLPIMYIVRIFKKIFTKGKIKESLNYINNMDDIKIEQYQKELNYVGLDFNFDN